MEEVSGYFTKIGAEAFSGCTALKKYNVTSSTTEIGKDAFNGVDVIHITALDAKKAFEKAQSSAFLRGECNGSGHESWKADFDFIIKPKNFIRIIEGVYDARGQPIDSGISYADMEADLLENI